MDAIKHVVIVGGGSAGWMTAATLAKVIGVDHCKVTLVESDNIPSVSVGEATIPQVQLFNRILGIDENEFLAATQATFKLGIEFIDWYQKGQAYFHPFGSYGTNIDALPFHHYWLKLQQAGFKTDLSSYSLAAVLAKQNRFTRPLQRGNSPLSAINYAYHFDATSYARFLSDFAQKLGVTRTVGTVEHVNLEPQSGHIDSLILQDGTVIKGDLYIDCSGFKGLLIEQALHTGFEDWSEYLPCNRAIAVPCQSQQPLKPYTESQAQDVGWTWRIPLQSRVGNGYVYASDFIDDDTAADVLLNKLESEPQQQLNHLKWTTGMRKKSWNKNCIAIGLSSGFVEPLESTGLHLIQSAIAKLMTLFPTKGFDQFDIDMFNRQTEKEYLRIRDFIVLHYKATNRSDTEFWRHCQNLPLSDELNEKLEMYQRTGRIVRVDEELFNETSWLAVMNGQGVKPRGYHPLVDRMDITEVQQRLHRVSSVVANSAELVLDHLQYIQNDCKWSG